MQSIVRGIVLGKFGGFLSRSFFFTRATSSGKDFQAVSSISSVRCAEVVGVTSRSRERHRESAGFGTDVLSHKVGENVSASQRWACKAPILLFIRDLSGAAAWGSPQTASSRRCSRASLKWELVVEAERDGDRRFARVLGL